MIVARATIHTPAAAPPQQLSSHPDVPRSSPPHRRLPQLDGEGGGPACRSRRSLLRHLGPKHWAVAVEPKHNTHKAPAGLKRQVDALRRVEMKRTLLSRELKELRILENEWAMEATALGAKAKASWMVLTAVSW